LLQRLAPHWGGDWWFLTYLGWARIEVGEVAPGIAEVERALAANPRNAYAAHARAHGCYEAGDAAGGAAFIAGWLPSYDRRSQLYGHLSWHRALFELAAGNSGEARALYEAEIRPGASHAPPLFALADAASFLWRWQVYRETPPIEDAWPEVLSHARRYFPVAGLPFADLHAVLAEAASGDDPAVAERVAQLRAILGAGRLPQGRSAPLLCAGVAAFARGEYALAAELLEPALAELPRVGGSHAQRDLFEDTFIAAALRAGRYDSATSRLGTRLARPRSAQDPRWLAGAAPGG